MCYEGQSQAGPLSRGPSWGSLGHKDSKTINIKGRSKLLPSTRRALSMSQKSPFLHFAPSDDFEIILVPEHLPLLNAMRRSPLEKTRENVGNFPQVGDLPPI